MKYIILLSDGMADEPIEELDGQTPLGAAYTPYMDELARQSEIGLANMIPAGMAPGSDTANLSAAGYDPQTYYSGRSPLEALSIGVDMKPDDVSFRCNLVTLSEWEDSYEDRHIIDHSSGEISSEDAAVLLDALIEGLSKDGYRFYAGTGYRHLLIWEEGEVLELTPPHDILTRQIGKYLPENAVLRDMMKKSYDILNTHPLNIKRAERGLNKANSAWFWGAGTRPALTSFEEKTGKKGVMVSAVDLLKGIAVGAGLTNLYVEGANGGLHTNYEGKAAAALDALLKDGYDFAYIHVEAPDEMGHQGKVRDKITAIEYIDEKILGKILREFEKEGEALRLLLLPDHPTPIRLRTHTGDAVPYLLYDSTSYVNGPKAYNESTAYESGNRCERGYMLIDRLLRK